MVMIKQIVIKHTSKDIEIIIDDILKYLSVLFLSLDRITCCFNLYENEMAILAEIKQTLESVIIQKNTSKKLRAKKYLDLELTILFSDITQLLKIIEKYELNVTIRCKTVVVCLNDNDGDFIVINSKDIRYLKLKDLS